MGCSLRALKAHFASCNELLRHFLQKSNPMNDSKNATSCWWSKQYTKHSGVRITPKERLAKYRCIFAPKTVLIWDSVFTYRTPPEGGKYMDFSPTTSQMFPIEEHLLVATALSGTLTLMKLLIFPSHLQPHSSRTGQELTAWLHSFNSEIKPFVQGACRWINWRSRSPNSLCCLRGAALGHFQKQRRSCFLWSADSAS